LAALAAFAPSAAGVMLLEPADGHFAANDQAFVLRIEDPPGALAVFVGTNDLTGVCALRAPGELRCSPALLPLRDGDQQVVVYAVNDATAWSEIARFPIQVGGVAPSSEAPFTPRLDLDQS